jgi:hypothetical protein
MHDTIHIFIVERYNLVWNYIHAHEVYKYPRVSSSFSFSFLPPKSATLSLSLASYVKLFEMLRVAASEYTFGMCIFETKPFAGCPGRRPTSSIHYIAPETYFVKKKVK